MERHRVKDAERPERLSKNKQLKPLGGAELALAVGKTTGSVDVQEDIKPGETKRFSIVYAPPTPRKRGSVGKTAGPAKKTVEKKKESTGKAVGRPAAPGGKKKPGRSVS